MRREPWQATYYGRGGKFDYHLDSGSFGGEKAGERERTVLVYLNTPQRGGETHFSRLDVRVEAITGRLVTWRNLDLQGQLDSQMLHSGAPVRAGSKTVLVTWVRERPILA